MALEDATCAEVLLFAQDLIDQGRAASTVTQAIAAILQHFQMADRGDPTKHKLVADQLAMAK